MFFTLLLGIFIGGMVVMFALANTSLVTISFFSDQITAPLAAVTIGFPRVGLFKVESTPAQATAIDREPYPCKGKLSNFPPYYCPLRSLRQLGHGQ